MKEKTKILLINSYSFEKIYHNWENGINPSHYLMGKVELERTGEFVVDIHPHQKYRWLDTVGKYLKIPYLDQQIRALFSLKHYDLIFMPYPLSTSRLLSLLKMAGLVKIPMIGLAHQNFIYYKKKDSILNQLAIKRIRQFDAFAFFSRRLLEKTSADLKLSHEDIKQKCFSVQWGADLDFYRNIKAVKPPDHVPYAVCAGTADRDYDMLIRAFENIPLNLKIYCTPNTIPQADRLPKNVSVDTTWVPYDKLLQAYINAEFIIIPLKEEIKNKGNTYGLTVLLDAIAVGKPVLMTYHPFLDIDLEKENIGLWVKDNTSEGWANRIKQMNSDGQLLVKMGQRAKELHVSKYNIENFARQLGKIFHEVVERA
ncbi:Glycosyltransferase involved in cell wall bisynthesis [Cyclobacterium lianum]|uniref:Glycosyltransferase involved in cell wall bisynthesis n=1 Tax=Cyclobacterium lianum TaxID=388280 RepID=A0A1M7NGL4_9BACT|nr:glycosyltransferase [Cyclobacterium lianum]SHN02800.1 Glycosyltransferase involved in cell wall bisynthesis [Cyclobacterium lianum]